MPTPIGVVARAVVTFENRSKLYIEVYEKPDFYNFYACTPVKPGGRKPKAPSHTWGFAQGRAKDLQELVEEYVKTRRDCSPKVVKTGVRIYKREEYEIFLHTPPDVLGLTKLIPMSNLPYVPRPRGDVYLPPDEYLTLQKRMDIVNPRKPR